MKRKERRQSACWPGSMPQVIADSQLVLCKAIDPRGTGGHQGCKGPKGDKGVQSELLSWGTLTNWIGNRNFQPISLQCGIQVFVTAYKGAPWIAKSKWNKVTGVQMVTRGEGSCGENKEFKVLNIFKMLQGT